MRALNGAALFLALPLCAIDLRADEEPLALAAFPAPEKQDTARVSTPGPRSAQRAAILDALRERMKTRSRFRVDHIRTTRRWAFVRATEVVALDDGEQQETDLTVAALLDCPSGASAGRWRIVDLWTLPGEPQRPLAEFVRRVRARVRAERLPAALLPNDF